MWIKRMVKIIGAMVMVSTLAIPVIAQGRAIRNGKQNGVANGTCLRLAATPPARPLSSAEAEGLTYLREQEKLAQDVYLQMFLKYDLPLFQKFSESEQRHFSALKVLLDRYGLPDPAVGKNVGEFSNPALRELYADLVNQGKVSLPAALRVGAGIEELDIRDLQKALRATDNSDLQMIYQNLQQGSTNHLRALSSRLQAMGETYAAQYLDEASMAEILALQSPAGMNMGFRGNGRMRTGRGNGACLWLTQ